MSPSDSNLHQFFGGTRRSQSLSSDTCQNILCKSAFEHFEETPTFAALLLASKSFQNSSFGAHFVMSFRVYDRTAALCKTVLSPSSCLPLQFAHSLSVSGSEPDPDDESEQRRSSKIEGDIVTFIADLANTKYLPLQLRSLVLDQVDARAVRAVFRNSVPYLQLQSLELTNCTRLDETAIELVAKYAVNLTHLSLWHSSCVSGPWLEHVAKLSHLTSLSLYNCERISSGVTHLSALTNLAVLDLTWCNITDDSIAALSNLTNMKNLNLSFCTEITDSGLAHLSRLSGITTLILNKLYAVSDKSLAHFAKYFPNLETLDLTALDRITDKGVKHLAQCRHIRKLLLTRCDNICDAALKHVSHLADIELLDLTWCTLVTDAGLEHLSKLTTMKSLHLTNCSHVTDVGLEHLSALNHLEELTLYGCEHTDAGKEKFKEKLPNCEIHG